MGSSSKSSSILVLVVLLVSLSSFHLLSLVTSFEFQVGDINGWVVPPKNDSKIYNDWASENRFQVGDTIRFKYKKDSVLEVSEIEYKKCNTTHPHFFSNTGNTVVNLDHQGPFYFISGASGHCDRGQRMIVTVMSRDDSQSGGGGSSSGFKPTAAAVLSYGGGVLMVAAPFVLTNICF